MVGIDRAFLFASILALALGGAWMAVTGASAQTMERREAYGAEASSHLGLFQTKCGACHAQAGPLVRDRLSLTATGTLVTSDDLDLRAFMRGHFGAPEESEIEAIYDALRRIAQGRGRFEVRCGICHASAEALAQKTLVLRGGTLFGRYSGREIADFLARHGTDNAGEAKFFTSVLRRQLTAGP